jgi:hypothetical protein
VANFAEGYELAFEQTAGKKPTREGTNKIYQQLYAMGKDVSQYGAGLPYSLTIDFLPDGIVTEAGVLYICLLANGPSSVTRLPGATGSETFWESIIPVTPPTPVEPEFTESYDSGEQTMTVGGLLTLAHGLASVPYNVQVWAVCAITNFNYNVGDIIHMRPGLSGNSGYGLLTDATNISIRFSSSDGIAYVDKTSGTGRTMSYTNWRLLVRAWA